MSEFGTPIEGVIDDDVYEMYAVFVAGETKTGKGAAGDTSANALTDAGYLVYYDVAGDYMRRFTELVRRNLGLGEQDSLPDLKDESLQQAAKSVYESRQAFEKDESLGDLQRESISNSVSILSELPVTQQAHKEWLTQSVVRARKIGANVIMLEGRNLRIRLNEQESSIQKNIVTVLDLFLTCDPETAARRTLLARNIPSPTQEQVKDETVIVIKRRDHDRNRPVNPFIMPAVFEEYVPGQSDVEDVVHRTWDQHGDADLPVSIVLDNSKVKKPDMLDAVSRLAVAAVKLKTEPVLVGR